MASGDMRDYYAYAKRVTAIHHEAMRRLLGRDDTHPLELAEMFENAANLYLDISEGIRARAISEEIRSLFPALRQSTEPWYLTRTLEEERRGSDQARTKDWPG